jgi:hypothetical protein
VNIVIGRDDEGAGVLFQSRYDLPK